MIAIPIGLFLTVVTLELCINSPVYAGVSTAYVGGMSLASFGTLGSGVWLLRHRKN